MENKRELILRMAEAEQELVDAVNAVIQKHSLPCFLVEFIVEKIHRQLVAGKENEWEQAKQREKTAEGKEETE